MATALEDVFSDADLFEILFARIGVVGVDDDRRMSEVAFAVGFIQALQVFIVVVRQAVAEAVDVPP